MPFLKTTRPDIGECPNPRRNRKCEQATKNVAADRMRYASAQVCLTFVPRLRATQQQGKARPRKQYFFEKKNQKTFARLRGALLKPPIDSTQSKVFCFFFSKKKYFFSCRWVSI
jgi:hypothetical protein